MKKILFAVLIVALLATLTAIVVLRKGPEGVAVDELLPAGAMAYARVDNLDKRIANFTATDFWQKIRKIDITKVMQESGADEELTTQYENLRQMVASPAAQQFLARFLGKEVAVAVYPTKVKELNLNSFVDIASNVIFMTRLEEDAGFMDFFIGLVSKVSKDIKQEVISYKGTDINMLSGPDGVMKLGYARIKGFLVFGFGDRPARNCIDIMSGEKPSLADDASYQLANKNAIEGADTLAYADLPRVVDNMKEQIVRLVQRQQADGEKAAHIRKSIDEGLKHVRHLQVAGLSSADGDISRLKFDLYFDASKLDAGLAPFFNCRAQDNATLLFVPRDVLGYQWGSCYDLDFYLEQVRKVEAEASSEGRAQQPFNPVSAVALSLGVDVEKDILPVIGDELGGYLADVDLEGMFPVPKLLLFVKIKDKDALVKTLAALAERQPFLRPQQEEYAGRTINYFSLPLMTDLQPAYAFVDSYLLVSTHYSQLKKSIDVASGKTASLGQDAVVKELALVLDKDVNSVLVVKTDKLMQKAGGVMNWANKWAEIEQSKQDAFQGGREKRIQDIALETAARQDELLARETELSALREKASDGSLERLRNTLLKKEKFINKFIKRMDPLREEEAQLLAVQTSEDKDLTPAGQEQLAELQATIKKRQGKIDELQAELAGLRQEELELSGLDIKVAELEKMLSADAQDIRSAEHARKELEDQSAEYEARRIDPKKREAVLRELFEPLLEAFNSLETVAIKSVFRDGVIENMLNFKLN